MPEKVPWDWITQWRPLVEQTLRRRPGPLDADDILAILTQSSSGEPDTIHAASGRVGLLAVPPSGGYSEDALLDPATNLDVGVQRLQAFAEQFQSATAGAHPRDLLGWVALAHYARDVPSAIEWLGGGSELPARVSQIDGFMQLTEAPAKHARRIMWNEEQLSGMPRHEFAASVPLRQQEAQALGFYSSNAARANIGTSAEEMARRYRAGLQGGEAAARGGKGKGGGMLLPLLAILSLGGLGVIAVKASKA